MHHLKRLKPEDEWARALLLGDEWANALTHGIGLFLSFIGLFFLVYLPLQEAHFWRLLSFGVYGGSLVLLYAASTCYHFSRHPKLKKAFRTFDHCAIYLLIAGSYTPFTLLVLDGVWGWAMFGAVWGLAIIGMILKIFYTHRFRIASTTLYLLMGWMIVIAAEPLAQNFHSVGIAWLVAGGLSYTLGVVFFVMDGRRFFHAIWHLFVMGGSACHFWAIFYYL